MTLKGEFRPFLFYFIIFIVLPETIRCAITAFAACIIVLLNVKEMSVVLAYDNFLWGLFIFIISRKLKHTYEKWFIIVLNSSKIKINGLTWWCEDSKQIFKMHEYEWSDSKFRKRGQGYNYYEYCMFIEGYKE